MKAVELSLYIQLIILIMLTLASCNNSDCENGEYYCMDNFTLAQCIDNKWQKIQNCKDNSLVCMDNKCTAEPEGIFSVEKLTIEDTKTVSLEFSNAFSEYVLIPYHFSSQNETVDFSFLFSDSIELYPEVSTKSNAPMSSNLSKKELSLKRDYQMRVRDRELWNNKKELLIYNDFKADDTNCKTSLDCGDMEICEKGNCTSTVTLNFDAWTIHTTLTANVLAKGNNCVLLGDQSDIGSELELSEEQINNFLDSCDNVVYPRTRTFYGDPKQISQSPLDDASDRNEDGLLHVLFSGKVNEEGVWGFFTSADFFENTLEDPSNERDMLYISLPEDSTEIASIKATMIHEYQHLIHFTIHNYIPFLNGKSPSYNPVWLDESFSHLSEEIGGYGIDNIGFVENVMENFSNYSLVFGSDNLSKRALGFLFMMYVFEQSGGFEFDNENEIIDNGGATFLQMVINSDSYGYEALEKALDISLDQIYFNWLVTMFVNNKGITDDHQYSYNDIITDPLTGYETGVVTYGSRTNIYDQTYYLEGPVFSEITVNPTDNAIQSTSAQYYRVTSSKGKVDIDISTLSDSIGLGIVRIH